MASKGRNGSIWSCDLVRDGMRTGVDTASLTRLAELDPPPIDLPTEGRRSLARRVPCGPGCPDDGHTVPRAEAKILPPAMDVLRQTIPTTPVSSGDGRSPRTWARFDRKSARRRRGEAWDRGRARTLRHHFGGVTLVGVSGSGRGAARPVRHRGGVHPGPDLGGRRLPSSVRSHERRQAVRLRARPWACWGGSLA